ncbi:MAG: type III secretion system chaperone [Pseudomonadota bacterium]
MGKTRLVSDAGIHRLRLVKTGVLSPMRPLTHSALALASLVMSAAPLSLAIAQSADPAPTEEQSPDALESEPEVPATIKAATNLLTIITTIDEEAQLAPNGATFTIDDTVVTLVFDVNADRMRLFAQIAPSDGLSGPQLRRLMQANFDTALDARYAIAQGQLWATFIHPLTSLTQDDFVSAVAQTVTLVKTYGTTYSSGAMSFGGGDSNAEIQKLLERLLEENEI